jgi:pyruvate dehydrogenase E2 component (dihydrolipoamide acetyltransferase)
MPSLGADMESGTLIAWHIAVGDHVAKGDVVAEVDTDKSVLDVEVFATGTVEQLLIPEGKRVPVGTPLAIIGEDSGATTERAPAPAGPLTAAPVPSAEPAPSLARETPPAGPRTPAPQRSAGQPAASPLARRHAEALGVDLAAVTGTGPGGAVTTTDVERFAGSRADRPPRAPSTAPAAPAIRGPEERPAAVPLTGPQRQAALRSAIGASMARSKREIPHYYLACDIDMSSAVRWLDERNAVLSVTDRLLPVTLLLKASALALRETPDLNGFWESGGFHQADGVHVGVAIALRGGGLVAPAIHDTDHLTLAELMVRLRDLVARVRTGGLRSSEMSEPTITVTNLGDQGVDSVFPVIYPPQVAIVGFGRTRERPSVVDGALGIHPMVTATLAADHRVTDGHRGAVFLTALERLLQAPEDL